MLSTFDMLLVDMHKLFCMDNVEVYVLEKNILTGKPVRRSVHGIVEYRRRRILYIRTPLLNSIAI